MSDSTWPSSGRIGFPRVAAEALVRNNVPLLAYIGGKPAAFTSKDHNFLPGETVEKQLIVINNCRETVDCECRWSLGISPAVSGSKTVSVPTGQQERIPLAFDLPAGLAPGKYELTATVKFSNGETPEGLLHHPRASAGRCRQAGRQDRPVGSQGRDGQVARKPGREVPARRRRRRSVRLRRADRRQGGADARWPGAQRGRRAQRPEGDRVRAGRRSRWKNGSASASTSTACATSSSG